MLPFALSNIEAWKRTFHGENIGAILQLFVEADSGGWFLGFLHSESARAEIEEIAQFREN